MGTPSSLSTLCLLLKAGADEWQRDSRFASIRTSAGFNVILGDPLSRRQSMSDERSCVSKESYIISAPTEASWRNVSPNWHDSTHTAINGSPSVSCRFVHGSWTLNVDCLQLTSEIFSWTVFICIFTFIHLELHCTLPTLISIMSFGRPPSFNVGFKPSPPDRGAFPLDHDGRSTQETPQYDLTF